MDDEKMKSMLTMITCVKGLVDIDHKQILSVAELAKLLNERIDLLKEAIENQNDINKSAFALIATQQAEIKNLENRIKELEAK